MAEEQRPAKPLCLPLNQAWTAIAIFCVLRQNVPIELGRSKDVKCMKIARKAVTSGRQG